jgi:hypothetical protein
VIYWNEQNLDLDHRDQEEAKEGRCCISSLSLSPLWIADSPFQAYNPDKFIPTYEEARSQAQDEGLPRNNAEVEQNWLLEKA